MSKATLVGRTIERPPAEVVQKRPEIEERRRVDITHIIAARRLWPFRLLGLFCFCWWP